MSGQAGARLAPERGPDRRVVKFRFGIAAAAGHEPGENRPPGVLPGRVVAQVKAPANAVAAVWQ